MADLAATTVLEIVRGDTLTDSWVYYAGLTDDELALLAAGDDPGVDPVDLTGYTARLQIRPDVDSSTTYLSLTSGGGTIVLGTTDGTITLAVPAATTAALTFDRGVFDLELTLGSVVTTILTGRVRLDKDSTR